jgi:hypothetical protein
MRSKLKVTSARSSFPSFPGVSGLWPSRLRLQWVRRFLARLAPTPLDPEGVSSGFKVAGSPFLARRQACANAERESGVVEIPDVAAPIHADVMQIIIRPVFSDACRQVRIGQEKTAECDCIGLAARDDLCSAFRCNARIHDKRPAIYFWRNTMPPRSSKPTTWNEVLPISIPITVIVLLRLWDMGCSLSLAPLARFVAGGAGARPDHPIKGHQHQLRRLTQILLNPTSLPRH